MWTKYWKEPLGSREGRSKCWWLSWPPRKTSDCRSAEWQRHGATVESLFEQAMELLAETLGKKKLGAKGRKSVGSTKLNGPYIAKAVKREVWERDAGRCTYQDPTGRRCSEKCGLEFDHTKPRAMGGEATPGNLRLRCKAHNQLHAEVCYGELFMAAKRKAPRAEELVAAYASRAGGGLDLHGERRGLR